MVGCGLSIMCGLLDFASPEDLKYSLSCTLYSFVHLFRGKRGKGYNVPDDRVWGVPSFSA